MPTMLPMTMPTMAPAPNPLLPPPSPVTTTVVGVGVGSATTVTVGGAFCRATTAILSERDALVGAILGADD